MRSKGSGGKIDEKRAIANLMDLLAIEGLSGRETLVAEAVRERAIAAGCKPEWIGFDQAHESIPGDFEIGNLIIKLPGTEKAPRRMLMGHMDTVPLCRGAKPVRKGKRIVSKGETGLGGDNRTAVAALVTVLETILRDEMPHPPLTLLFTVGEEIGLWGARYVKTDDLGDPEIGFNIDGGNPAEIAIGALGADRWEVDVIGRSAHAGAHPEDGVSATLIASRAIADAAGRGYFGKIRKGKKKRGSANVGIIRGGEATNQVTDGVYVKGESRSHDAKFVKKITATWKKAFERAARKVKNASGTSGKVRFRATPDYAAFRMDPRDPTVRLTVAAAGTLGLEAKLVSVDGGLDANYLNQHGVPTVTLGAGQHRPHTVDEYIEIREYLDGCRLALACATTG